jgi:hypothetical protein
MNQNKTLIVLLFLVLHTGCVEQGETTTTSTTTSPVTTTSTTTTTTSSSTTTTTAGEKTQLVRCREKENKVERDNCYLSLAVGTGNTSICDLIERASTKSICIENTQVEKDGRSTVIEGYVVNKTTNLVIKNVDVKAISKIYGEEVATDNTDSKGFYSMDVPSRDTYNITVVILGREFTQEVYARTGWTHELWFRVP